MVVVLLFFVCLWIVGFVGEFVKLLSCFGVVCFGSVVSVILSVWLIMCRWLCICLLS